MQCISRMCMNTSTNSSNLSHTEFAEQIVAEMVEQPLLTKIRQTVVKKRELGIADSRIKEDILSDGLPEKQLSNGDAITVFHMPAEYNQLDWA